MHECDIKPLSQKPSHLTGKYVTFTKAIQYTDAYLGKELNTQSHYRYRRYLEVLKCVEVSKRRKAHVDIGCGAGIFSWALLDWMTSEGSISQGLGLYGFDHSVEMINLAQQIGGRLEKKISTYPTWHYHADVDFFLQALSSNHKDNTDYLVTFGHVLAQSHDASDIGTFVQIITHILDTKDTGSSCSLVAVDARGSSKSFSAGWDSLLKLLYLEDISHKDITVPSTSINSNSCAKIAVLQSGC